MKKPFTPNHPHPGQVPPLQQVGNRSGKTLVIMGILVLLLWAALALEKQAVVIKNPSQAIKPTQAVPLSTSPRTACQVLFVYDGDTFACDLNRNGHIEKPREQIRLLGIDTPEMHYSPKNRTKQDEPGAKVASNWLTHHLKHKTVYLEWDVRPTDKYGRQLAFVFDAPASKVSINETLVRLGLARVLFIGENRKYRRQLEQASFDQAALSSSE